MYVVQVCVFPVLPYQVLSFPAVNGHFPIKSFCAGAPASEPAGMQPGLEFSEQNSVMRDIT